MHVTNQQEVVAHEEEDIMQYAAAVNEDNEQIQDSPDDQIPDK
jgi:hypothetical protein